MGAQQSIDTLTALVDPYSALESPRNTETSETPTVTAPASVLRRQPSVSSYSSSAASSSASASTSHISLTIDTDEIEINPPHPIKPVTVVEPPTSREPVLDDPVDQIMSRIAPPAVVAMLSSPQSSASELPVFNPRSS